MSLSGLRTGDPRQVGEWTLVGRLGAGGMGVVYLAQGSDGRLVALKRLREDLASDSEFRERFRREAAALLRVQGTCTARVLTVDVETSSPYVVMEYVQGPTLAEYVGEHGPLSDGMAHGFAVGLAEALAAIHRAGVVHRDLKPVNVLLSEQGPKVIDFGIAQAADATALTRAGAAVGTVGYMAPEQVRGQAGPPADVFAWALTVAYATTGRPPFGTGPAEAVLHRVLHEEPDLDGVPPRLRALLASALAGSPERRPTPGQLLSELTGAEDPGTLLDVEAVTVLATVWQIPEAAAPPASVPRRRTAWFAAAGAVLLLTTAGILWNVLPGYGRSDSVRPDVPSGPDGPQRPGLDVVLRTCGNFSGQIWRHDETDLHLTNTPSGLCLDTNGKPATGVPAVLNPCGNYTGQQWRYDADSGRLANPASGLCLDTNGPPASNVALVLNPCGNHTGQGWRM
ncbi:Serine/threonine-protein kinase PknD [Streptomyces tanashiensis]